MDSPLSRLGSLLLLLLALFNFSRQRRRCCLLMESWCLLTQPRPLRLTARGLKAAPLCHRPNKPPPASVATAAHHISGLRHKAPALLEQTRCSHFGSQAIPHPLLQPLARFQLPADHGTAPPTLLKWCRSLSHKLQ